jgi:hypothetical protein
MRLRYTERGICQGYRNYSKLAIWDDLMYDHTLVGKIVPIAVIGWNYSLFPENSQSDLYENIENTLPSDIDALGFASIMELIEKMADEKRSLYPDVNRMIQGYKFRTNALGEKVLDVTTVSIQK